MSRSLRQIPNVISAIRILLVVPICMALVRHQLLSAIFLFAAAAVSDAADGYLAKRFDWRTELGAVLDPLADKLLLSTVLLTLAYMELVPPWLVIAAVARDVIIVAGASLFRLCIGPLDMRPSILSKFNTLCQAAFILAVVCRAAASVPPAWLVTWLGALMFVTVAISGIDYVLIYGRRALNSREPRSAARAGDRPA